MKLPELKTKFKKKYMIRIAAGILVVALIGTGASAYEVSAAKNTTGAASAVSVSENTDETEEALSKALSSSVTINEKEIGKEETVYIIADSKGNAKETIVSDHLINHDGKDSLQDASTLKDITNVKGDETFTQNGTKLVWKAEGNDIYYQGTSSEEAPVIEKLTYYLDGKEIAPKDLAGKSGKVTLRFDYTNNETAEADIDGKKEEVYVPFVVITGMVLDDSFTGVEVTNGKVIADGSKNLVIGYTLPGLKESLGVEKEDFDTDISIPDYFEVTANVENFSLDMTMTVVMNATNFISAERDGEASSLDELFESLTDATDQLQEGSAALADGVDTLQSKLGDFQNGMNTLADGVTTLKNGAGTLADGASALNSSAKAISDGIAALDQTLKAPLTEDEKTTYNAQAIATVEAAFAEGTDTYNYIYNSAKQSFSDSLNANADSIYLGLRYNADGSDSALYSNLFAAGYAKTLEEQFQAALPGLYQGRGLDPAALTVAQYQQMRSDFEAYAAGQIAAGVMPVVESSLQQLAAGIVQGIAAQGADTTAANVVNACKTASGQAAASALVTGIETTKSTIASSIEAKQSNGYSLVTGAAALSQGTQELAGKVPELVNGVNALDDGAVKLKDGTGAIVEGVGTLGNGAHELADGIVTFNEEGIEKILNSYNGEIEPLMDRIQAVLDAGADYQSYTDIAEGMNGSVKFIYKTAAVK